MNQHNINAKVAQLVEHNLAKVRVAGSSPVFRSNRRHESRFFCRKVLAQMAELVDALVSGTSVGNNVQVRALFRAHRKDIETVSAGGEIGIHATLRW